MGLLLLYFLVGYMVVDFFEDEQEVNAVLIPAKHTITSSETRIFAYFFIFFFVVNYLFSIDCKGI